MQSTVQSTVATDSAVLFGNTMLGAILGVIYWTMAAQVYNIAEVGFTSAIVSTSTLIALISNLGLSAVVVRYLPVAGEQSRRLATAACLVPGIVALIVTSVLLWLPAGRALTPGGDPAQAIAPVLMAIFMSVAFVQDSIFIARRQARLVLVRGLGATAVRFALLFPLAGLGAQGLILAFVAGSLSSVILGASAWSRRSIPETSCEFTPSEMVKYGGTNYLSGLFTQAPQMLYPVLIASQVSHEAAGAFAFVWMPVSLLLALPASVANVLMSQIAREGKGADRLIDKVTVILAATIAALCVVIFGGVSLFAMVVLPEAASNIQIFLPLMLAGAVPFAVVRMQSMLMAYQAQLKALLIVNGAVAALAVVLPLALLSGFGVIGLQIGWLMSQLAGALIGWLLRRRSDRVIPGRQLLGVS